MRRFTIGIISYFMLAFTATQSATFYPLPLEQQLKHADGAVLATHRGSKYKKLSDGQVVTQHSFKVNKVSGIKLEEMPNPGAFQVLVPGGEWQGITYQISGSPEFKNGEEVFLVLKKGVFGYQIHNLSLGHFEYINKRGRIYLRNKVFQNHPKLGRIKMEEVDLILKERFNVPLEEVRINHYVYKKDTHEKSRSPASLAKDKEDEAKIARENSRLNIFWLVVLLAFLGVFSIYVSKKS